MGRTAEHYIWTGDYADRLDAIEAAHKAALADRTPLTAGEQHPAEQLAEEYEQLKGEADNAGLRVMLRGLRDDEWDELVDAHPPRTEEPWAEQDKSLGFDEQSGLRDFVRAGLLSPKHETRSAFDAWIVEHDLGRGDLKMIAAKVWRMTNGGSSIDPKSLPPLPIRTADEPSE